MLDSQHYFSKILNTLCQPWFLFISTNKELSTVQKEVVSRLTFVPYTSNMCFGPWEKSTWSRCTQETGLRYQALKMAKGAFCCRSGWEVSEFNDTQSKTAQWYSHVQGLFERDESPLEWSLVKDPTNT